jgi:hypothetical protein
MTPAVTEVCRSQRGMPRDFEQATPEDVFYFQSQPGQSEESFDDMHSRRKWMSRPVSDHAAEAAGQPTFFFLRCGIGLGCGVREEQLGSVGGQRQTGLARQHQGLAFYGDSPPPSLPAAAAPE